MTEEAYFKCGEGSIQTLVQEKTENTKIDRCENSLR